MIAALWKRIPDYAQHALFAALLFGVVATPMHVAGGGIFASVAGWVAGVFWYWSREARDAEIHNPGLFDRFAVLWPPNWHADARSDFYWPLGTTTALAAALEILTRL